MDFVSGFPRTARGHNAIWVIVDRLTKSAHFLGMKTTDTSETLSQLYIQGIVRLHGVPLFIVSDCDSRFWKSLQQAIGTELHFSIAFHPQTDGQSERVIQIVEDMLRDCVSDFKGSWSNHFPLVEFAYNNSYQASIGMAPYVALYGRPCRSPTCWLEAGESSLFGPEIVWKLQRRFNSSGRGYSRFKLDKKAMWIDDEDPWNFKRGIMYSSRCHPKRECLDSVRRES